MGHELRALLSLRHDIAQSALFSRDVGCVYINCGGEKSFAVLRHYSKVSAPEAISHTCMCCRKLTTLASQLDIVACLIVFIQCY
jgi:hypothetical protein